MSQRIKYNNEFEVGLDSKSNTHWRNYLKSFFTKKYHINIDKRISKGMDIRKPFLRSIFYIKLISNANVGNDKADANLLNVIVELG